MYSIDDMDACVIARTNLPDAINAALCHPGHFYLGIEIHWFSGLFLPKREILQKTHVGVPDLNVHILILTLLLVNTLHSIMSDGLHMTASCVHNYVSANLTAVVCEAGMLAIKCFLVSAPPSFAESAHLTAPDLATVLSTVHPFMLHAHTIATPPACFADIGRLVSMIAHSHDCPLAQLPACTSVLSGHWCTGRDLCILACMCLKVCCCVGCLVAARQC